MYLHSMDCSSLCICISYFWYILVEYNYWAVSCVYICMQCVCVCCVCVCVYVCVCVLVCMCVCVCVCVYVCMY